MLVLDGNRYGTRDRATFPYTQSQTDLNRTKQHWYSTGSGSDRAPCKEGVSMGAPGRYRSRYCTAACTNVACSDLDIRVVSFSSPSGEYTVSFHCPEGGSTKRIRLSMILSSPLAKCLVSR